MDPKPITKTLSTEIFIKIKSLREVLDTHNNLNDTDKKYIIELISNILKTEQNLNFDKYILFLLYCNKKCNTGRFCLIFNDFFDNLIKNRNEKGIRDIIIDFKETCFFEYYNNKLLDEIEKNCIKQMIDIEYIIRMYK